ncbi:MAG TPA: MBL fold metallo-hydrolase [Candidatus Binataceae bacterium]|jgi:glyoxylase-like metal-dependent hydrolase (beta-lactamase superfamily II)|nr:MBL fold metallo-hydrolase [Candidatus Binataceae bacterium]
MNRWKIGDVTITRVVEMETTSKATFVLKDGTPENIRTVPWLRPHFAAEDGKVIMSVHALVVESQGLRIIVDTCIGNDKRRPFPGWNMLQLPFLADLERAGFPRDSIDRVLCTHLHVDHVGWNTMLVNGKWVPTFARARYLIGRKEWEHWSTVEAADTRDILDDSVRPVFDAGLTELVESDHRITDEVRLEPTPGHTPGHHSVRISSRGQEAVITGDLMHHPVQMAHPEWGSFFDSDYEQAIKTRREFLARYGDKPILVLGTHFATPTAGRIVRDGDTWRFAV